MCESERERELFGFVVKIREQGKNSIVSCDQTSRACYFGRDWSFQLSKTAVNTWWGQRTPTLLHVACNSFLFGRFRKREWIDACHALHTAALHLHPLSSITTVSAPLWGAQLSTDWPVSRFFSFFNSSTPNKRAATGVILSSLRPRWRQWGYGGWMSYFEA